MLAWSRQMDDARRRTSAIEETLKKHCIKTFKAIPGVNFLLSFYGDDGNTLLDHPRVCISYVQARPTKHESLNYVFLEGAWVGYDDFPNGYEAYPHKVKHGPPPFDPDALRALCDKLATELGMPVVYRPITLAVPKDGRLRSEDDLLLRHPNAVIEGTGKIWHVGWDIPDSWVVLRTPEGGKHLYYSTNGHGFGFDNHIVPGQDPAPFFAFVDAAFDGRGTNPDVPRALREQLQMNTKP